MLSLSKVRANAGLFVALLGVVAACGTNGHDEPLGTQRQRVADADGHYTEGCNLGESRVQVGWAMAPGARPASTMIPYTIYNNTRSPATASVTLRTFGLDERIITRSLGNFSVGAGANDFAFMASAIPIQSVGSQSQVYLDVKLSSAGGPEIGRSFSVPMQYEFSADYGTILIYGVDRKAIPAGGAAGYFGAEPDGTITPTVGAASNLLMSIATALLSPTGRVWNGSHFIEVSTLAPITDDHSRHFGTSVMDDPAGEILFKISFGSDTSGILPYRVCSTWWGQFKDAGFGEGYGNTQNEQTMAARRTMARLIHVGPNKEVWSGALDQSGCTPSSVQLTPNESYILVQSTDVADMSVFYRTDHWSKVYYYRLDGTLVSTVGRRPTLLTTFKVTGGFGGLIKLKPTWMDSATKAMFVLSQLVRDDLDIALSPPGAPERGFDVVVDERCPRDNSGTNPSGCYDKTGGPSGTIWLGAITKPVGSENVIVDYDANWKFIIAHESGHAVQDDHMGPPSDFESWGKDVYTENPSSEVLCNCDHVVDQTTAQHCLQSRERDAAAQIEGWAQFFASRVWNNPSSDDCTFVYYKELKVPAPGGPTVIAPPLARACNALAPGQSFVQWMDTYCPASTGLNVEYDWMMFFEAANRTSSRTTINDFHEIYRTACNASLPAKCGTTQTRFSKLADAADAYYGADDDRAKHFRNMGIQAGINH